MKAVRLGVLTNVTMGTALLSYVLQCIFVGEYWIFGEMLNFNLKTYFATWPIILPIPRQLNSDGKRPPLKVLVFINQFASRQISGDSYCDP
jgi:hypothetical protein